MIFRRYFNFSLLVLWALFATWFVYLANGKMFGIDDSDIFFAYSKNLAAGNGIIYSPGIPRVEGYTSTLWMLMSSVMFLVGLNESGVLLITVILFIISHLIVCRILDRTTQKNTFYLKVFYIGLISSSFGYLSWTTVTLMDTGLWSVIIISLTYILLFSAKDKEPGVLSSTLFFLAPLARPEAFLLCPVILILLCFKLRREGSRISPVVNLAWVFLFSTVTLTIFRFLYFGYPLPNTYYAKVSSSFSYNLREGLKYFLSFLNSSVINNIAISWAIFSGMLCIHRKLKPFNLNQSELLSLVLCSLLIVPILSGGDHFNLFRFYQPMYPLLALFLTLKVAQYFSFDRYPLRIVFPMCFIWIFFLSSGNHWLQVIRQGSPIKIEFDIAKRGRSIGQSLNKIFTEESGGFPSIGVITAGGVARTYRGSIFDLMGLNNAFIAHFPGERKGIKNHAAFEVEAFFELPIDLVPESPQNGFSQMALKGIFNHPKFIELWTYGRLFKKSDPEEYLEAFVSKKFIDKLSENSVYKFNETQKYNSDEKRWVSIANDGLGCRGTEPRI